MADGDDSIAIGRNSTTLEKAVAVGLLVKYHLTTTTTKSHFDLLIRKRTITIYNPFNVTNTVFVSAIQANAWAEGAISVGV